MGYAKTTWSKGDVITSGKLNNIQGGIYNSLLKPYVIVMNKDVKGNWYVQLNPNLIPSDLIGIFLQTNEDINGSNYTYFFYIDEVIIRNDDIFYIPQIDANYTKSTGILKQIETT